MRIAVIGATGLVGRRLLERLPREQPFGDAEILALASARSAGETLSTVHREYTVREAVLDELTTSPPDLAFIAAGKEVSRKFAPALAEAGVAVVDKSRVFRMHPEVPLVVGGVNDAALDGHSGIIANPNCSTVQLVHCLAPLGEFRLKRAVVSTYQSVSGAGKEALDRLHSENRRLADAEDGAVVATDPEGYAGNVIPRVGGLDDRGRSSEEVKLDEESQKILGLPEFAVEASACRVPVYVGHAESVTLELERDPGPEAVAEALRGSEYLRYFPNTEGEQPSPIRAADHDLVEVGRLRRSNVFDNGYSFFCAADNLGVGAALNGIRIARSLLERELIPARV